jgi:hypothetical protein
VALTLDPRFVIELQPSRHAPVTAATYRRRRLLALLAVGLVAVALLLGGRTVLADRGGAPASAPTVSPAQAALAAPATYTVRPGDSLWSIAERFAGTRSQVSYVDALIALNGGASVQAGQTITLP